AWMTAERFIPDPFGSEPGARLYRTGDLALYLPTGNIEFLGRLDHQVKLRGFRIELGEVEAALDTHPAIGKAIVTTRKDPVAGSSLVAYIVPTSLGNGTSHSGLSAGELSGHLSTRVPRSMIPNTHVSSTDVALTPTST